MKKYGTFYGMNWSKPAMPMKGTTFSEAWLVPKMFGSCNAIWTWLLTPILLFANKMELWWLVTLHPTQLVRNFSWIYTRALPGIMSGPEVRQIFKIRTVRKPDVFLPRHLSFITLKKNHIFFVYLFGLGTFDTKFACRDPIS